MRIGLKTLLFSLLLASLAPVSAPLLAAALPVPKIDHSTPKTQDGLTLMAISRGNFQGMYQYPVPAGMSFLNGPNANGIPGGFGLWIRSSKPMPAPRKVGRFLEYVSPPQLTATAQELGGGPISVQCQQVNISVMNGQAQPLMYLVSVPAGYPVPFAPIDVTVTAPGAHPAHWRLIDLPPSYNAVPARTPLHRAYYGAGVVIKASAWLTNNPGYYRDGNNAQSAPGINYQFTATVPRGTHWLLNIMRQDLEWEALSPAQQTLPGNFSVPVHYVPPPLFETYFGDTLPTRAAGGNPQGQSMGMIMAPYAAENNKLRLSGNLIQVAQARETLTFHHLNIHAVTLPEAFRRSNPHFHPPPSYAVYAKPQTVVTPSGISVTLLPFSDLPQNGGFMGGMGNGFQVLLRFNGPAPDGVAFSLPHSPLGKEYHKPVSLKVTGSHPIFLQGLIPVNSFGGFPAEKSGMEFIAQLTTFGSGHFVSTMVHGRRVMTYQTPALPKYLSTLSFTLTQEARLRSMPVDFVVPIEKQAPVQRRFSPTVRF
jgi:hypothetical protein